MTLFIYALKRSLRTTSNIIVIMILPIVLIFLPSFQGGIMPQGLAMYGMIVLFSAFLLSKQLIDNRSNQTIIRIAASPLSHIKYLTSFLLAFSVILWVQNTVFLAVMIWYWGAAIHNVFLILMLYYVYSVSSISFCLFWNSMFKTYYTSLALFAGVASLMSMITGITLPLSMLPDTLLRFSVFLPPYWLAYGLDMVYNNLNSSVLLSISIMTVFSIIFIMIGSQRRF